MANFRKNIRFTDVCEKFTNSSEMDFSEWFDKAQYAFEAMARGRWVSRSMRIKYRCCRCT